MVDLKIAWEYEESDLQVERLQVIIGETVWSPQQHWKCLVLERKLTDHLKWGTCKLAEKETGTFYVFVVTGAASREVHLDVTKDQTAEGDLGHFFLHLYLG